QTEFPGTDCLYRAVGICEFGVSRENVVPFRIALVTMISDAGADRYGYDCEKIQSFCHTFIKQSADGDFAFTAVKIIVSVCFFYIKYHFEHLLFEQSRQECGNGREEYDDQHHDTHDGQDMQYIGQCCLYPHLPVGDTATCYQGESSRRCHVCQGKVHDKHQREMDWVNAEFCGYRHEYRTEQYDQ